MGIALYEKISNEIKFDSFLSWPVPSSWSLEDSTTVPLSYSIVIHSRTRTIEWDLNGSVLFQAYYVFYVLSTLQKNKSVLVTSGLHPIGQAAISIALAENCEIYAVVESCREADQLSHLFPEVIWKITLFTPDYRHRWFWIFQLSRSRIFINAHDKFDIKLMMATKSKGMDIILNFLSGEAFRAAYRTIGFAGQFFHFSKSDLNNYKKMGN